MRDDAEEDVSFLCVCEGRMIGGYKASASSKCDDAGVYNGMDILLAL